MKGLLLKDIYMTRSYLKSFLLVMLVFYGIGIFAPGNSFFLVYPAIFAGIMPITMLTYDEGFKWDVYSLTMPLDRKTIVREKYIFAAICVATVSILTLLVILVKQAMGSASDSNLISLLAFTIVGGLIVPVIELPLVFKFGVAKSRFIYLILVGMLAAVTAAISGSDALNVRIPLILSFAAGVVLLLVSMVLSEKFYEKREL